jgi:glutamine phosphoribosylpyrophosphate amidotransferase
VPIILVKGDFFMKVGKYTRDNNDFSAALDWLQTRYFHNGGDEDAEVIINWNKREAKEDRVLTLYGTNSVISNAIKRCRKGIAAVDILEEGATLYLDLKAVRPLYTVLKILK